MYTDDARVLGLIGTTFRTAALPRIRVVVPRALAEHAVVAWQREDVGELPRPENPADRQRRQRAGALALIGFAISEHGQVDVDGNTIVELSPELVGVAMDAADDFA
ncbi:hypothetical protein ACFWUU_29640 [Kribbella sp. NPDC058693]|uniref:hypothetical protein n=1 Tax=Kribbella sp. NPDC058693 TaxID=3346602 RepID=UPI00365D3FD2